MIRTPKVIVNRNESGFYISDTQIVISEDSLERDGHNYQTSVMHEIVQVDTPALSG